MSKRRTMEPAAFGARRVQDPTHAPNTAAANLRKVWRVDCSFPGCTEFRTHGAGAYIDGELLRKNIAGMGWRLLPGLPPLCRTHAPRAAVPAAVPEIIPLPLSSFQGAPAMTAAPALPPMMDVRLMVAITEHLQEKFDKENGRYLNDWSDAKIAAAVGAAPAVVEKIRREAFAELREDPELAALRKEIEQLTREREAMVVAFDHKLADIARRFQAYVQAKRPK